ncbi:hypothetical protein QYF36_016745 [Acer negundo]|nr:hypothetical protein QYF36_016745 [Acer negundo]
MSPIAVDGAQSGTVKGFETVGTIFEIEDSDILKLLDRPRPINVEKNRSFDEKSFSEMSISLTSRILDHLDNVSSPSRRSGFATPRSSSYFESNPIVADAWDALRRSLVYFREQPVGTIAASDHSTDEELNYDQVFVRDFVPSALAFLMNGEDAIVKNFLLKTLRLQSWEKKVDLFQLGEGVMPASFKVLHDPVRNSEKLIADFVLLWLLTAACIKTGRPQIARRAIELAERRLSKDHWPEYYDGKNGRFIGKQARKFQTWSISGYLVAKMMLEDPSHLGMISLEEDKQLAPLVKRSTSWTC